MFWKLGSSYNNMLEKMSYWFTTASSEKFIKYAEEFADIFEELKFSRSDIENAIKRIKAEQDEIKKGKIYGEQDALWVEYNKKHPYSKGFRGANYDLISYDEWIIRIKNFTNLHYLSDNMKVTILGFILIEV
jgi:predicted Zn-dependent peptidase